MTRCHSTKLSPIQCPRCLGPMPVSDIISQVQIAVPSPSPICASMSAAQPCHAATALHMAMASARMAAWGLCVNGSDGAVSGLCGIWWQWSEPTGLGVFLLVASAVLSRGFSVCQQDMDFPTTLVTNHGYCSQVRHRWLPIAACHRLELPRHCSGSGQRLFGRRS